MIFFTADMHLFHDAVLKFERRPFSSVKEMNDEIIRRWNCLVSQKDETYILGDVSFGGKDETMAAIKKLNGQKLLVAGNHDKLNAELKSLFGWVKDYYKLRYNGMRFILFHYPKYSWDGKEKGSMHLHGHVHTNSHHDVEIINKVNVGMDLWSYAPVSMDEVLKLYIARQEAEPDRARHCI